MVIVVHVHESKCPVSIEDPEFKVLEPCLRIELSNVGKLSSGLVYELEQLRLFRWFLRYDNTRSLRSPPREAPDPQKHGREQGTPGTRRWRNGADERVGDTKHRQAAMMNVHADRPL